MPETDAPKKETTNSDKSSQTVEQIIADLRRADRSSNADEAGSRLLSDSQIKPLFIPNGNCYRCHPPRENGIPLRDYGALMISVRRICTSNR